jgi:hypothetical protein
MRAARKAARPQAARPQAARPQAARPQAARNAKNIQFGQAFQVNFFYREGFVYLYDELSSPGIKSSRS